MTQMTYLSLADNQLSALPADIFSGLSSLGYLELSTNQLSALPAGIFAGLSSLGRVLLSLDPNALECAQISAQQRAALIYYDGPSALCAPTIITSSRSTPPPLPSSNTTPTPGDAATTTTPAPATPSSTPRPRSSSTTTPTPAATTTTTPAPATPTPSAVTSKLTLTTELTPQQQFSVKSAYWGMVLTVAQVPIENVEMRKDAHQVSDTITLVSYIVTVYVKDAAAAAAVTTRLTDTAALKMAFIAAGLNVSLVDKAFFAPPVQVVSPSATTDGASLFSVLHGDCNGTMSVKCATNYTGEALRARYQRCGKDRCGGPACTATEPVFAKGGTGNSMPSEDEFEVWVIVCHKFFPSRHDLSVCV